MNFPGHWSHYSLGDICVTGIVLLKYQNNGSCMLVVSYEELKTEVGYRG